MTIPKFRLGDKVIFDNTTCTITGVQLLGRYGDDSGVTYHVTDNETGEHALYVQEKRIKEFQLNIFQ